MKMTSEAKQFWDKIPPKIQVKLLNNVWCTSCRKMTGISQTSGNVEKGDLILKGVCTACTGPLARLIEGS